MPDADLRYWSICSNQKVSATPSDRLSYEEVSKKRLLHEQWCLERKDCPAFAAMLAMV